MNWGQCVGSCEVKCVGESLFGASCSIGVKLAVFAKKFYVMLVIATD